MKGVLIRDMAMAERPRERIMKHGAEALKDEELLALVLRTGYNGRGVVEVARETLLKCSIAGLLTKSVANLSALRGFGISRAAGFLAAAELIRRADKESKGILPVLRSLDDIVAQAADIRDKKKEYLIAIFLNARSEMIAKDVISIGTLTASLAHPREIFSPAIGKAAAGVILAHNHPSGDPSPSNEDIRLTKRIARAGNIMGIELLDHIIVVTNGYHSFKTGRRFP